MTVWKTALCLLMIKKREVTVVACQFRQLGTEPGVTSTCGLYSDTDSVDDRILPDAWTIKPVQITTFVDTFL